MPLLPFRRLATVLRRSLPAALAVAAATLTSAGCGGASEVRVGGGAPVAIALSEFRIVPQDLHVAPGRRTFVVRNAGTMVHRFELRSEDGARRVAIGRPLRPGQSERLTVQLVPGRYLVRCAQERHDTLGERGTLDVG